MNNSSRILIVVPTLNFGGAEKVAVNLANSYIKTGANVTVLVFRNTGNLLEELDSSIELISLNSSKVYFSIFPLYNAIKKIKPGITISVILECNILLGALKLITNPGKLVMRQANTLNDVVSEKPFMIKYIYLLLIKLFYKNADKIIANSNDTKLDLLRYNLVSDKNIHVIDNPVLPYNFYEKSLTKMDHNWLGNKKYFTLLNVGRLCQQKNQRMLIEAFRIAHSERSSLKLIIIGQGELFNDLSSLVNSYCLENSIQFLDPVVNPYPYFKNADLFVLTSLYEGFGNVLVEALAFNTPVISTNCPGGPNGILKNGEYGSLVDVDNENELAQRIIEYYDGVIKPIRTDDYSLKYSSDYVASCYLENL